MCIRDRDRDALKFTKCLMKSSGTLEVEAKSDAFTSHINFEWEFNFLLFRLTGTGIVDISSKKIGFRQSYVHGKTSTSMAVEWALDNIKISGDSVDMLTDWIKTVVNEKLIPGVTLLLNSRLSPMDRELLKPYDKMTLQKGSKVITIANSVMTSHGGTYDGKDYIIINFGATISSPNITYTKKANAGVNTEFSDTPKFFDYEVCYNPKLFGEYLNFLIHIDNATFNETKEKDYPRYVSYYKTILQRLGSLYSDDTKVTISFEAHKKDFAYLSGNRLLISATISFLVNQEIFLTLNAKYTVVNNVTLNGEKHLTSSLIEPKFTSVESNPEFVGYERLLIIDLASRLARQMEGFKLAESNGLSVGSLRPKDHMLLGIEFRDEEVCYLYQDKGK
eukprot:TRINITY_DN3501_c0_g1_i5.p1 TRINITY_DN3501_c0_g1~~TRINITY_DN3501_c0_g1_i5.p1  ORF type:complete len:391 (+),score=109.60 TRINITY_DN3501_c0_g1_i5:73-1245(+)